MRAVITPAKGKVHYLNGGFEPLCWYEIDVQDGLVIDYEDIPPAFDVCHACKQRARSEFKGWPPTSEVA